MTGWQAVPSLQPTLDRFAHRYPRPLVDGVADREPGRRIRTVKNVTVGEEFFQGHFPGTPLMPGVLMIEALAQSATLLLVEREGASAGHRVWLRGVDKAKFRRQVVPGDRLRLDVALGPRRGAIVRAMATAHLGDELVAEAVLVLAIEADAIVIDQTAHVHSDAVLGAGTVVGPNAIVGPRVTLGRRCRVGASAVIDGLTILGDDNVVYPFASIGLPPQDQKYAGEETSLVIGDRNIFREFVTIHRGTAGGGGRTTIGHQNLFMAYVHVAHDCHIGSRTIFGNNATLGGHVSVGDCASVSAGSGVHQFCRVGRHAFIGGYSVITKDALPFARTVGARPARLYGLNVIGLRRRGFSDETIAKLRRAYRYLLQSRLNATQAVAHIEGDPDLACEEVSYLVRFIRTATRGAILRRGRKADDSTADE